MSDPADAELTHEEALELADELGQELYRAEDRIAFVREMLDQQTAPVAVERVRAWLDRPVCPRAESEQEQIKRLRAQLDRIREWSGTTQHGAAAAEIRRILEPDGTRR